jgi:hypothetical protein
LPHFYFHSSYMPDRPLVDYVDFTVVTIIIFEKVPLSVKGGGTSKIGSTKGV